MRNVEFNNVEIETATPDARAAMWLDDVADSDFSRLKLPASRKGPAFVLNKVSDFRVVGSRSLADRTVSSTDHKEF